MPLFSRILVPTDLTEFSAFALRHAIKHAETAGTELHLLHVMEEIEGGDMAGVSPLNDVYSRLREVVTVELRLISREYSGENLTVSQNVTRGTSAAPVILDYAHENDIELIVMGTRGRQGDDRFEIGSTAERVVRFADCSVLTVGKHGTWMPGVVRRIVAAVDFSDSSEMTVRWARALAHFHQSSLSLVHVIEPIIRPVFYKENKNVYTFQGNRLHEEARSELRNLYQKSGGPQVNVNYQVLRGRPARQIVRYAEENRCNLIVQGTRGLSKRRGAARLGTVAEKVVRKAPCPVFTGRKNPPKKQKSKSARNHKTVADKQEES